MLTLLLNHTILPLLTSLFWSLAHKCSIILSHTQVKIALLVILSCSMINHFPLPRSKTHKDAHGQISDDESLARRWFQSLMRRSVRLPALVATVASIPWDAMWQLLHSLSSSLFSLLFNYPQLSLVVFVSSGRRSKKKKKWIAYCHAVCKSLLRPR